MGDRRVQEVVGIACAAAMIGLGSGRVIGGSRDCKMNAPAACASDLEAPNQAALHSRMARLAHTEMAG